MIIINSCNTFCNIFNDLILINKNSTQCFLFGLNRYNWRNTCPAPNKTGIPPCALTRTLGRDHPQALPTYRTLSDSASVGGSSQILRWVWRRNWASRPDRRCRSGQTPKSQGDVCSEWTFDGRRRGASLLRTSHTWPSYSAQRLSLGRRLSPYPRSD